MVYLPELLREAEVERDELRRVWAWGPLSSVTSQKGAGLVLGTPTTAGVWEGNLKASLRTRTDGDVAVAAPWEGRMEPMALAS